jgi:hypothetical protein
MAGKFAQTSTDPEVKSVLNDYAVKSEEYINDIKQIFEQEKAVVPVGFDSKDVFNDAPPLFDDIFHMMFLRNTGRLNLAFNSAHMSMSFRQDIRDYYAKAHRFSEDTYNTSTNYLTAQGVLSRPPYVTAPKQVEFIEQKSYMSGFQFGGNKRALNTLEVAYLYTILETNVFGMQLSTGFAQVAKERESRDYFFRGKEISKKIIGTISKILLSSDIQAPTTWAGKANDSIVPPFSDKMMMYFINILSSSALAASSMGMAFSMRGDLAGHLALMMVDISTYAKDGGKLMIEHKWLEEPPQMENRNDLIKSKQ